MDIELIQGLSASVIIVLVIQGLKALGLPTKVAPLIAIVFGVGISLSFALYGDTDVWEWVLRGVAVGLTSVGLFSGVKNTGEYVKE